MTTRVVNRRKDIFDVDIGRGSPWGNPYKIGEDGTREQVIALYKVWFYGRLESSPIFHDLTLQLSGKVLGCYCKPKPCHGDIIKEWLDDQPKSSLP